MEPVSDAKFKATLELLKGADCVVDAGFPVGGLNRRNMDLIYESFLLGKPVFSLRSGSVAEGPRAKSGREPIRCEGISELLERLEASERMRCTMEEEVVAAGARQGMGTH